MSETFVARVNPSFKMLLHLLFMTLIVFAKEPSVTFAFMLIPFVLALLVARLPLRTFALRLLPFLLVFATTVFSFAAYSKGTNVLGEWGWFRFTEEGVLNGLNLGFRMLGFVAYGLLFALTTDLTLFALSLMQQLRVPPKFAYALLAGFRFLPMFRDEYEQIKAAHRVRGVGRLPGVRGKLQALIRYTIPLLAQAIRKSERVAVALEARGFDGTMNRTFYRQLKLGAADAVYLLLLVLLHGAVLGWVLLQP